MAPRAAKAGTARLAPSPRGERSSDITIEPAMSDKGDVALCRGCEQPFETFSGAATQTVTLRSERGIKFASRSRQSEPEDGRKDQRQLGRKRRRFPKRGLGYMRLSAKPRERFRYAWRVARKNRGCATNKTRESFRRPRGGFYPRMLIGVDVETKRLER